ncbi:MAG: Unknown protein [uncultured Sulfurovum sp.]|uniref:PD-(D/E)XK nuclease superfamily protein n=1 Tax=uncultured Sulfurovum sp. TaxID=269237 RepID=A0A6S6SQV3_9BACT|nr:MAG: Unknown protein [uncultured Sulfurovum sp.]
MNSLTHFLDEVQELRDKHEKLNQRDAKGFNLFSLLLKSTDEVNLHSKFIYELLNPKGSHHQARLFLNLFLEELGLEVSSKDLDVFREKENIDILIESSQGVIVIENKIHSEDHSSQLSRYIKSMQNQGYKRKNISLVYLTLFGHQPTEKKMQNSSIIISYRKNIVRWLERSLKEIENIPILRETLQQYLNLVKELTYQSTQKGYLVEVKKLLLQENKLQQIMALEEPILEAKIETQLLFWHTLLAKLMPHYAFSFYNINNDKSLKNSVRRYYNLQKNHQDYGVRYQVEENLHFFIELRKNIYYGFEFENEENVELEQKKVLDELEVVWEEGSSLIYWKYPSKKLNFRKFNHQNIFDLLNEKQREKDISRISREIINIISNYKRSMACLVE